MRMTMTALILAAGRSDGADPVAVAEGVSSKMRVELLGRPMIAHVVGALAASQGIGRLYLATDDPTLIDADAELARLAGSGRLSSVPAGASLTASVLAAADAIDDPFPLLVSTGDNALHTPQIVERFVADCSAAPADVCIGMTPAAVLLERYPGEGRAFHRLRDGGWSSCNLYALMTPDALKAAEAFRGGGQFGKRPLRILQAFGLRALMLYKSRLASLDGLMRQLSRRYGLRIRAVRVMDPDAPIDVDSLRDLALTREILTRRCANA